MRQYYNGGLLGQTKRPHDFPMVGGLTRMKMVRKPAESRESFIKVWQEHVLALKDVYEMNP